MTGSAERKFDSRIAEAVIQVGDGRGFVVERRVEDPPFEGRRCFVRKRFVITAAHCLPKFPPCDPASSSEVRTYRDLLGPRGKNQTAVWAECLFADPVGDVAVLGSPDDQDFAEQADAYGTLVSSVPPIRIDKSPSEKSRAWLLSLDGRWTSCTAEPIGKVLWIAPSRMVQPGMSGSPILAEDGAAFGTMSVGGVVDSSDESGHMNPSGPHPMLSDHLPVWIAKGRR